MSEKRAREKRRTEVPKRKQFFKPLTVTIKGEEVYIPRTKRRIIMRKFMTDLKKGRINLEDIARKKAEMNHERRQEQGS